MAGAIRSANMDRYIQDFLRRNPDGIMVELGCGLETTYWCNDNGKNLWYGVDLPTVIEYRHNLLGQPERDTLLAADTFGADWIQEIRTVWPDAPILVTAGGLFYYFEREKVLGLLRILREHGPVEVVFDTVNAAGMKRMGKYMKGVGHEDAAMYFYVDSGAELAREVGAELLGEEPYYAHTPKHGLNFVTASTMRASDWLKMVKMIHLRLKD